MKREIWRAMIVDETDILVIIYFFDLWQRNRFMTVYSKRITTFSIFHNRSGRGILCSQQLHVDLTKIFTILLNQYSAKHLHKIVSYVYSLQFCMFQYVMWLRNSTKRHLFYVFENSCAWFKYNCPICFQSS